MRLPPKNISFSVRLDSQLKEDAEELFGELGLSLGSAMNIFLKQSVRLKGFPFNIKLETSVENKNADGNSQESVADNDKLG